MEVRGHLSVHFCGTRLQGEDLWFPLNGDDLFKVVENLMFANKIAFNVTAINESNSYAACTDYIVTYNGIL
jgi:hypothetical protein